MVQKIQEGWTDYDAVIATPDMMRSAGRLGKVLGPRGLMPNPKTGTVTFDVAQGRQEIKAGKVEFRLDKTGIIHSPVGKISFHRAKLAGNAHALLGGDSKGEACGRQGQVHQENHADFHDGPGDSDRSRRGGSAVAAAAVTGVQDCRNWRSGMKKKAEKKTDADELQARAGERLDRDPDHVPRHHRGAGHASCAARWKPPAASTSGEEHVGRTRRRGHAGGGAAQGSQGHEFHFLHAHRSRGAGESADQSRQGTFPHSSSRQDGWRAGLFRSRKSSNLAQLPSKEELISKVMFLFNAPAQRIATVMSAVSRNLAVVTSEAVKANKFAGGDAVATPVAES